MLRVVCWLVVRGLPCVVARVQRFSCACWCSLGLFVVCFMCCLLYVVVVVGLRFGVFCVVFSACCYYLCFCFGVVCVLRFECYELFDVCFVLFVLWCMVIVVLRV